MKTLVISAVAATALALASCTSTSTTSSSPAGSMPGMTEAEHANMMKRGAGQ